MRAQAAFNLDDPRIVDRSRIDAQLDVTGDDVGLIRIDDEVADRRYRFLHLERVALDAEDQLARGAQRVGPAPHRDRTGVSRDAVEPHAKSALPRDRRD